MSTQSTVSQDAALPAARAEAHSLRKPGQHNWIHGLPFKMRFKRSKLYVSAIPVLLLGALVGVLASIMGVGGGFIMVPAMIYLLRVPTNVVIGTSLFQILFVTAATTMVHSVQSKTVDIVLASLLLVGGVIGGAGGAIVGSATTPKNCVAYDRYGRPYRVVCP